MRKTLLLLFATLLVSGFSFAQTSAPKVIKKTQAAKKIKKHANKAATVIWTNDFSNASDWTMNDNGANGNWEILSSWPSNLANYNIPESASESGQPYALFNSDGAGNGANNSDLTVANAIDCSPYSNVALKFNSFAAEYQSSVFTVLVSTDGTNFTQVAELYSDLATNTTTQNPDVQIIDITSIAAGQSTVYIRFNFQGNYDYFWAIDDVTLFKPDPWDAKLTQLNIDRFVPAGNVDIKGTIFNNGGNTITDITVKWTDGTNVYSQDLTGLNIPFFGTYEFTHSTQLDANTINDYHITAWVELANDADSTNDYAETDVASISTIPTKKVMGEEATGTWCGWCPRGLVGLKDLAHYHPDTWIGVGVHNGDPMVVSEYDGNMNVGGYPSGYVDRTDGEVDPGYFSDVYDIRINDKEPASVEVVNAVWDAGTNTVTFDVKATFYTTINKEFRLNAVITEDNVTGTSSSWDQKNYYSSSAGNIDLIDWEGINWKNLPNPVAASDMVYNHVARAILGGFNGQANSVPASISDGQEVTYTFSYTVPSGQKPEDMELIGFLIFSETGEIINADKIELPISTTIATEISNNTKLYPNPTKGILNIEGIEGSTVEIFNNLGQLVVSKTNTSNLETIDMSNFDNGTYIVRITTGDKVAVKKVNIQK